MKRFASVLINHRRGGATFVRRPGRCRASDLHRHDGEPRDVRADRLSVQTQCFASRRRPEQIICIKADSCKRQESDNQCFRNYSLNGPASPLIDRRRCAGRSRTARSSRVKTQIPAAQMKVRCCLLRASGSNGRPPVPARSVLQRRGWCRTVLPTAAAMRRWIFRPLTHAAPPEHSG